MNVLKQISIMRTLTYSDCLSIHRFWTEVDITFGIAHHENLPNTRANIYWDLNWLHQSDPKLINFIRNEILIPPSASHKKLNLDVNISKTEAEPWLIQGQFGEAALVEQLYNIIEKKYGKNGKPKGKKMYDSGQTQTGTYAV